MVNVCLFFGIFPGSRLKASTNLESHSFNHYETLWTTSKVQLPEPWQRVGILCKCLIVVHDIVVQMAFIWDKWNFNDLQSHTHCTCICIWKTETKVLNVWPLSQITFIIKLLLLTFSTLANCWGNLTNSSSQHCLRGRGGSFSVSTWLKNCILCYIQLFEKLRMWKQCFP